MYVTLKKQFFEEDETFSSQWELSSIWSPNTAADIMLQDEGKHRGVRCVCLNPIYAHKTAIIRLPAQGSQFECWGEFDSRKQLYRRLLLRQVLEKLCDKLFPSLPPAQLPVSDPIEKFWKNFVTSFFPLPPLLSSDPTAKFSPPTEKGP